MVEKYGDRYLVTRKLAGTLLAIAVGCCVLIGLVTFYAARPSTTTIAESEPIAEPEPTAAEKHKKVTDVRLPRHLTPELYTLQLVPFIIPDNFTIRGHVEIRMLCNEAADNVTLHVADILVENSTVALTEAYSGREITITGHEYDKDREFYISKLGETLQPGKMYSIKIAYTAYLKDNLKGFYRSVYKDQQTGKDEYITVTQFQATDARRAFPCFDEPGIKAEVDQDAGVPSALAHELREGGDRLELDGRRVQVVEHRLESTVDVYEAEHGLDHGVVLVEEEEDDGVRERRLLRHLP